MKQEIKNLLSRIQELETKKSLSGYSEEVEVIADGIETRVNNLFASCSSSEEEKVLLSALDRIENLRSQHSSDDEEFEYDEGAELDMMFPNRKDDDFDEDSMSPDSVFGEDQTSFTTE